MAEMEIAKTPKGTCRKVADIWRSSACVCRRKRRVQKGNISTLRRG